MRIKNKAKTMSDKKQIISYDSSTEKETRKEFLELFEECPIPNNQLLSNLGLYLNSKTLSRILFMNHIYQKIVSVQGVIMEFGVRWGQNLSLFAALRGIYEPFNRHRKIIGFDTFEGFPKIHDKDGTSKMMKEGQLSLTEKYENYLEKILDCQEKDNPLSHIKKFILCKGDGANTIQKYFEQNPETIIALAYFDFDLYEPTRECLRAIKPRLVKGSILGFDELNDPDSPGETLALMEVFGLENIKLKRFPYTSRVSYFEVQ